MTSHYNYIRTSLLNDPLMSNLQFLGVLMFKAGLILCCIFFCHFLQAQVPPGQHWKKIITTHFDVIYPDTSATLAAHYADALERNYEALDKLFLQKPLKTVVVLNDNTDLTNGYAVPAPYPMIMIFPVMPGPSSSIGEYSYWPSDITLHEYTHILSFSQIRGFFKVAQSAFGQLIIPNAFLPRWFLEGVAVYTETALSNTGRLRSKYQSATLRAMTEESTLVKYRFEEINQSDLDTWPYGSRPYLFGSLMWDQMQKNKDPELINRLHQHYGGRMPFMIGGPAEDEFGINYPNIYSNMLNQLNMEYQTQLSELSKIPFTNKKIIVSAPSIANSPSYNHKGDRLALLKTSPGDDPEVKIYNENNKSIKYKKLPSGDIQSVSWLNDDSGLLYEKLTYKTAFEQYYDIYLYKFKDGKSEQLTKGIRGHHPIQSLDSHLIYFVKQSGGQNELAQVDQSGENLKILYHAPESYRISKPQILNANELLFIERDTAQTDTIFKINLTTLEKTALYTSRNSLIDIFVSPSLGVLFVDGNTGVYNVYQLQNSIAKPLTHVSTGVFEVAYNKKNNKLATTVMTAHGLSVAEIEEVDWKKTPAQLPTQSATFKSPIENNQNILREPIVYKEEEYSPLSYLKPYYWLPEFYATQKDTVIGFQTAGADPLSQHIYTIAANHNTKTEKSEYFLSYTNQVSPVAINLIGSQNYIHYLTVPEPKKENQILLTGSWYLPWKLPKLQASLTIDKTDEEWYDYRFNNLGFIAQLQYLNISKTVTQISPETGWAVGSLFKNYNNELSDIKYNQLTLTGNHFFEVPVLEHHAVSFRWLASATDEDMSLVRSPYQSVNYNMTSSSISYDWLMRGFNSSQFVSYRLANINLEYRFPIKKSWFGYGTMPFFVKRLHGALVYDATQFKGRVYDLASNDYPINDEKKIYSDYGAELKADITLGYLMQLTAYLGVYLPNVNKKGFQKQFIIGFQL